MKVLVIAETKQGKVKKSTLELLGAAQSWGAETAVLLAGSGVAGEVETLGRHGASKVYLADDASLGMYVTAPFAALAVEAVKASGADLVLVADSETGKDLAPRVAAKLDLPFIPGAVAVSPEGGKLSAKRTSIAGKVMETVEASLPAVVTVKAGTFEPKEVGGTAATESLALPQTDLRAIVREVLKETSERVDLGDARIVVAGGRAVRGPEGAKLIEDLADVLGAAVGASRAACDAGYFPHSCQVGQTGRTVAPDVYIAIGISGAIQHTAGMTGSKVIVAINTDPDAPIFSIADFGIVADLFTVVPILTEEFKRLKAGNTVAV